MFDFITGWIEAGGVLLRSGERIQAALIVAAIGVVPDVALARAAGPLRRARQQAGHRTGPGRR